MLEIIIIGLTALLNLVIGLLVFTKNPRGLTNRFFFALTATFVVWTIINQISVHPVLLPQIYWIRLVLFSGAMLNFFVFMTFLAFPSYTLRQNFKVLARTLAAITLFVMFLTLTPLVFKGVRTVNNSSQPIPNPGIALFLLHTVGLVGASIIIVIKKFRSSTGRARDQLRLVLLGIVGTFSLIVLTNFLMVVLFRNTSLVPFGPAFTLIFSGSFAYAIIKHRLFDIRSYAARIMAYLLSLSALGGIYALFIFILSEYLVKGGQLTVVQRALYIASAVLSALIFPFTKRFFDRITNRIFYQDAYDPQLVIGLINRVLVSNIELNPLLNQIANILQEHLKAEYCLFAINVGEEQSTIVAAGNGTDFQDKDLRLLQKIIPESPQKLLSADALSEHFERFRKFMTRRNIAVVGRLDANITTAENGTGFLILGDKRSGNPYGKQDLRLLEIITNELVIAIQNALRFEEIQAFAETLQQRVNAATHRLQHTNEKLKALDETKDEFISMASHQLRTPLTSVKGYLSMVLEGDAGELNEMQRKLLGQAFISSQRMVYLIADLLNVSRLKTGKFVIETQPTNLADVVEGEVNQLLDTAKGRNLTLQYKKPAHFPTLMLDETKIRQVIMNFTDNAIYYTPAGGHITLEVVDKKDTIEFTCTDDGIGVPKAEQHHLFSKFYRAGNAQKARPDGTGLGLFMAQKVIVAQGGSILFRSHEGKGSMFGFTFAKSRLQPVPATIKGKTSP